MRALLALLLLAGPAGAGGFGPVAATVPAAGGGPAQVIEYWVEVEPAVGARVVAGGAPGIEWRQEVVARVRTASGEPVSATTRAWTRGLAVHCGRGTARDLSDSVERNGTLVVRWTCAWLQGEG